jgi:hippurate hydrolase
MGAEDFSYFLEHKPGAYLFIGNGTESDGSCLTGLHNPEYDFNDGALITGANFFCAIVAHWLGHEKCTSI